MEIRNIGVTTYKAVYNTEKIKVNIFFYYQIPARGCRAGIKS